MEIKKSGSLTYIKASKGKYLSSKNRNFVCHGIIFLKPGDSPSNYTEISQIEYNKLRKPYGV
nr:MAG TPA: hypothetical protein [Caudoviricetes sp.]